MSPDELREAALRIAERTRREQGLPRYIEDPLTLDRLAILLDVPDDKPLGKAS